MIGTLTGADGLRRLALATLATALAAQILSRWAGAWGSVPGQTLWNAAQVGHLLMLLGLSLQDRRWMVVGGMAIIWAPFSIYAVSPGAVIQCLALLATCAFALLRPIADLPISFVDAAPREQPVSNKFEALALVCNLLCSLYNYNASKLCWPYWSAMFDRVDAAFGWGGQQLALATALFTLGIDGLQLPDAITPGRGGSTFGAAVFLIIWTVLPALYVLYFAALAKLSAGTPGARFQRALCLYCIVHFLVLTDLVAYQFGRGLQNPLAEWAHWSERIVWRIAILLPIYQKVMKGDFIRDRALVGKAMHCGIASWAIFFFLYQVIYYDVPRFAQFVRGLEPTYHELFGLSYRQELGYHGALLLMIALYAAMLALPRSRSRPNL